MVRKEQWASFRFNNLNNDLNKEEDDDNSDNDDANVDMILPEDEVDTQLHKDMMQVLANRIGDMSVSIEQLTKYTELSDNLKTNINNNY